MIFKLLSVFARMLMFFMNLWSKEYTQDKRDLDRIRFFIETEVKKRKRKRKKRGP